MPVKKWVELTTSDFTNMQKENVVVLLPIGSTEQHGPHLPVGTDYLGVGAVVNDIAAQSPDLDLLILPAIWCSKSNEHREYAGTVYLKRNTFSLLLEDICASVAGSGFKKLVLLNWHGGNIDLLASLARDFHQQFDIQIFVIDAFRLLISYQVNWLEPYSFNIHACRFETSAMLAKYPSLVREEKYWGGPSDYARGKMSKSFAGFKHLVPEGGKINMGWVTKDLTDDGVIGDPSGSNAQEGQKFIQFVVDYVCEILQEIKAFKFK